MYSNFGAQQSPSKGIHFTFLTTLDQSKFEQLFLQSAASFGGNKVGAQAVSDLLRQSNLDQASLAKIWDLSCISKSSFMTFPEFATAMFLTSQKLLGQELPSILPLSISQEIHTAMNQISSTESIQQLSQQFNHTHIQPPLTPSPMMMGVVPQVPMGTTHLQNSQRISPVLPQTTAHTGYIGNTSMQTNAFSMTPNPTRDQFNNPDQSSWRISPQENQKYHEIFHAWEQSGFISGETAKDLLTQSRLAPEILMAIWNLADSENRGSLNLDEFCIAMHLVYRKLNGFEVPAVLPSELKRSSQGDQKRDRVRYDQHNDTVENLRRQIDQEKRLLDCMNVPRAKSSVKFTIEELKEKIKKLHAEHAHLFEENPAAVRYDEDSRVLLNLMETQRSLQEEIQYICHREIPVLASQLRGAAAELKDAKSHQDNRAPDYLDWIQPTGPDGSVTESDRVRAKARAMMAARKQGNFGVNSGYALRRAEEEKQEANRIADAIERETEHSKTNLIDMKSDLRFLEQMTAHLDDKKRFETSRQDLAFELRRFIQELSPIDFSRDSCSTTSFNKSPSPSLVHSSTSSSTSFRSSPVPNVVETRPRTAEDIKKEAELRVQERLAALQAKRNPGGLPMGDGRMVISKPDDAEVDVEERNRIEKENEERRQQEELEEEKAFEERRRKRLEKEEADRRARYEAIQRAEEEEEERKRAEQSQSSQKAVSTPVHKESPPLTVTPLPNTTKNDIQQPSTITDTSNPYTNLQKPSVDTLQAEKPKDRTDKRESYNPFSSFSAFSATKMGSSDSDSDGWSDNDEDEEDEEEFPAAGSAKTMAGKLSSVLNQMHGVSSPSIPKSSTQDIPSPSIAPKAPTAPPPPPPDQAPISTPISSSAGNTSSGNTRNALLDQIQLGKKLKKTVTNDRSSSSVAGQVLN